MDVLKDEPVGEEYELSEEHMKGFQPQVLHNYNCLPVNAIDFSPNGQKLISSSDDGVIVIYKVDEDGSQEKTFENEVDPHGVSLVTYAASNTDVLHATTNGDYTVRRFDTFATKYCQIYRGHSDEIFNLEMGQGSNYFVTSSRDKSILLWDINQETPQLTFPKPPEAVSVGGNECGVVGVDPESLVVAVGTKSDRCVRMYDIRLVGRGPFAKHQLLAGTGDPRRKLNQHFGFDFEWQSLRFSESGGLLLIGTSGTYIPVLDAHSGAEKFTVEFKTPKCYKPPSGYGNLRNDVIFTPDSQYIMAASDDGFIHVFDTVKGQLVTKLHHFDQRGAIGSLKFNPQFMMFASARMQTALWLTSYDDDIEPEPLVAPVIIPPLMTATPKRTDLRSNANKQVEEVLTRRRSARIREYAHAPSPSTKDDLDKDLESYMSLRKSRPRKLIAPVKKATGDEDIKKADAVTTVNTPTVNPFQEKIEKS